MKLSILQRLEEKTSVNACLKFEPGEATMNISSSFLRDTQHISAHDRRAVPGTTAFQDRLQSFERCTRFPGPPAQRSHRHKRLKVSAQATETVPQSQLPQSLRNNLVRLQAEGPSGTCNVYLLGVSHVSQVKSLQLHRLQLPSLFTCSSGPETTWQQQQVISVAFCSVWNSAQPISLVVQCWLLMQSIHSSCIYQWQLAHSTDLNMLVEPLTPIHSMRCGELWFTSPVSSSP